MAISPGVYRIRNAKSCTVFDLGSSAGYVHGWKQHDHPNQHWFVQLTGEGVALRNFEAGHYAYTTSAHNGSRLFGSGNFTTWNLSQNGNEWTISLPGTNYVVDLDDGKEANGTAIHLWANNGVKQQRWIFEKISDAQPQQLQLPINISQQFQPPQQHIQKIYQQTVPLPVSPGIYFLRNVMGGTVVSLCGGSTNEGAEISGYVCSGENHQKWQLQPTGHDQIINLRNAQTNTYLWFQSQSFVPSVLVKSSYQPQEYVISAANRGFYISPAQQPNHVLSLFHGSAENGTEIGIWHNEQQDNQKWYFDRTLCEVRQPNFSIIAADPKTS